VGWKDYDGGKLAACLAAGEQSTLLVDCDSQANATAAILDNLFERLARNQGGKGSARGVLCEPDSSGCIGLGIAIDEECRLFTGSEASG